MIPVPGGVRVWLATGVTDMRRGMNTLALQVQEDLERDPHAGDLYVFRGRRGDLVKILWHDGVGISLYAKRLERGRFVWPSASGGKVTVTPVQLSMLSGINAATVPGSVENCFDRLSHGGIGERMAGRPSGLTDSCGSVEPGRWRIPTTNVVQDALEFQFIRFRLDYGGLGKSLRQEPAAVGREKIIV